MDLKQLKALVTTVECGFNISQAAEKLFLVQSAVSQQIARLEEEVTVKIFQRHGKRIAGLTPAGEEIVRYAYRTLASANSILEIGKDHHHVSDSMLRIGATHTQAQYILSPVIHAFRREYPEVEVQIHQGTPVQLVTKALQNEVDFSICTEALGSHPDLVSLASYRWNRALIAKRDHPILQHADITLELLCHYPIVTYVRGFTGREVFNDTFRQAGLEPKVLLSAADSDVIKTYVRADMGIGVIAKMAYVDEKDDDLEYRDLGHLFPVETTRIAYQKDKYLRQHQQRFIDIFQQHVRKQDKLLPP